MKMIRHDDHCLDHEGVARHDVSEHGAKQRDILRCAEEFSPIVGRKRKKIGTALGPRPSISHISPHVGCR